MIKAEFFMMLHILNKDMCCDASSQNTFFYTLSTGKNFSTISDTPTEKTILNENSQKGLISKLYNAMNSEMYHSSGQHKHKWEKDVGYEYTLKEWENLLQKSQKILVITKRRLMQFIFTTYIIPHIGYISSAPIHLLNAQDVTQIMGISYTFWKSHI